MRKMVPMERTPAEKASAMADMIMPSVASAPDYPPGLCICLTQDELDKLDLADDCEVGDMLDLRAMAVVTSVSKRQTNGVDECRVELSISHIAVESEDDEDE